MMPIVVMTLLVGQPPSPAEMPGGYVSAAQWRPPEPKDGADELLAAEILLPLGALATASGAGLTWATAAPNCPQSLRSISPNMKASDCRPLFIVNAIRTTYGAAMLVSGAVLLGVGLHRRARHKKWARGETTFAPVWLRGGGGLGMRMSF